MLQSEINLQTVTATDHLSKNILCQKKQSKKNQKKIKWVKYICKSLADKIECAV